MRNEKDNSKWPTIIRDGIEEAWRYLRNYGPLYVYILGHADETLNSDEFHQWIIEQYSQARHEREGKPLASYKRGAEEELINKALRGEGHTYMTGPVRADPPLAEIVFTHPHKSGDASLYTLAIHEYSHVFQSSFPRTPSWMMEGGADFFSRYLGIELFSRKVHAAGITPGPDSAFMIQVASNLTDPVDGFLLGKRFLILDRDKKFTAEFRASSEDAVTDVIRLPYRSPNLNAYLERFVLSIKRECLDRMIFFGEQSLRRAVGEFISHYHGERDHQVLTTG